MSRTAVNSPLSNRPIVIAVNNDKRHSLAYVSRTWIVASSLASFTCLETRLTVALCL